MRNLVKYIVKARVHEKFKFKTVNSRLLAGYTDNFNVFINDFVCIDKICMHLLNKKRLITHPYLCDIVHCTPLISVRDDVLRYQLGAKTMFYRCRYTSPTGTQYYAWSRQA